MTTLPAKPGRSEILIYQTDDGKTRIEVRLDNETVWLSQKLMAELFQVSVPTVNEHIRNLYDEGELQPTATIRKFRIVQTEASKQNMGLTSWFGSRLSKSDIEIAKNYLNQKEIEVLNRIVTIYLDFAELQALDRKPMYMHNWIAKLDEFLKLSNRELLDHSGTVSHEQAIEKASTEYEKYRSLHINDPSPVERHFLEAMKEVKRLEKESKVRATRETRKGKGK